MVIRMPHKNDELVADILTGIAQALKPERFIMKIPDDVMAELLEHNPELRDRFDPQLGLVLGYVRIHTPSTARAFVEAAGAQ